MKSVLVTGGSGRIAAHLRPGLVREYRLRLTDLVRPPTLVTGETFEAADLRDLQDMLRVTRAIDAVVHLGGIPVEAEWSAILPANIAGTCNLFEAARQNGVKRVLFASSNHVTGFYRCSERVDHTTYPRPDSRYGVAKVFGEQLGSLYADRYGMEVFCMRIGHVHPVPLDERRLSIWLSPRDLIQLVRIGLEHPAIRYEVVYGVSANTRSYYDNRNAQRLGYAPVDDSEAFASTLLAATDRAPVPAGAYQGGSYTSPAIDADLPPVPRST